MLNLMREIIRIEWIHQLKQLELELRIELHKIRFEMSNWTI